MNRTILLVGLNHRTAGVDIRERFSLGSNGDGAIRALPCSGAVSESLILSTCNRVELLATGNGDTQGQMLDNWARLCNAKPEDLHPYIYVHKDLEAVRHLFSVASSLDSMVLGEPQILGQIKTAYRNAIQSHTTGVILNRLLHKAFSVAKRVRTETAIASSAVSISYAAVELAKRIFGDMKGHKTLLVGAGEMAELAAMHLLQAGIDEIVVTNRTLARGQELARQFRGRAVPFEQMGAELTRADIIITSTGSRDPVLRASNLRPVLKARKNRPMFFIDIAVPRDIDPDVNELDNVYLYDIDDLKEVVEENLATRKEEAVKAGKIVNEEVLSFGRWLSSLDVQPTIIDLIQRGERLGQEELAKTLKRLGPVSDETRDALLALVGSLVRKLNHDPIMFLKQDGMAQEGSDPRINAVRRIFNLDKGCMYSENS